MNSVSSGALQSQSRISNDLPQRQAILTIYKRIFTKADYEMAIVNFSGLIGLWYLIRRARKKGSRMVPRTVQRSFNRLRVRFSLTDGARFGGSCLIHGPPLTPLPLRTERENLSVSGDAGIEEVKSPVLRSPPVFSHSRCPPEVHRSCICVRFIAEHTKMLEDSTKVNPSSSFVSDYPRRGDERDESNRPR